MWSVTLSRMKIGEIWGSGLATTHQHAARHGQLTNAALAAWVRYPPDTQRVKKAPDVPGLGDKENV